MEQFQVNLYNEISSLVGMIQSYENVDLHQKCLSLIPLKRIKDNAKRRFYLSSGNNDDQLIWGRDSTSKKAGATEESSFFQELLMWFKNEFFSWPCTQICEKCNIEMQLRAHREGRNSSIAYYEEYVCPSCEVVIEHARYIDVNILLQTRTGRCSEWNQVFCLFCRALGWRARYVLDFSDHVWVEIYSDYKERWIHCDPCEGVLDSPLMYELGWNRTPYLIVAVSAYDVQDVTWRYSCSHAAVRACRTKELNDYVLTNIVFWRNYLQRNIPKSELPYIHKILIQELVEFLAEPKPDSAYSDRCSGPLEWRLSRGESTAQSSNLSKLSTEKERYEGAVSHRFGFRMNRASSTVEDLNASWNHQQEYSSDGSFEWKPNTLEVSKKELHILYNCAFNFYSRDIEAKDVYAYDWKKCIHSSNNIFRKYELDWGMAYLARKEGCLEGNISWKINTEESGTVIDKIFIKCKVFNINTGKIIIDICGSENRVTIIRECTNNNQPDHFDKGDIYETSALKGSTYAVLLVKLFGGEGSLAWQYSQLCRQDVKDEEFPLHIKVLLTEQ